MAERWIVHDRNGHALQRDAVANGAPLVLANPRLASCFTSHDDAKHAIDEYSRWLFTKELPTSIVRDLTISSFDTSDGDEVLDRMCAARRNDGEVLA